MKLIKNIGHIWAQTIPMGDKSEWAILPPATKKAFIGRCGPGASARSVSMYVFNLACTIHDFEYQSGGNNVDRREADETFFRNLLIGSKIEPNRVKRRCYAFIAHIMYNSVRALGWIFFTYGDYLSAEEILKRNAAKFQRNS